MVNPLVEPLFVGDHSALDFVNTRATPGGVPVEWLGGGPALATWLRIAALVPSPELSAHAPDDALARRARALREWLREGLARKEGSAARNPFTADLAPLNEILALGCAHGHVDRRGKTLVRSVLERFRSSASVLVPVAESIASLLADENLEHVRRCEGDGCTLWFVDRTKSHRRRFCSTALCGNRAKVAAFRARQRQAAGQD